jgi:hypothetical protein
MTKSCQCVLSWFSRLKSGALGALSRGGGSHHASATSMTSHHKRRLPVCEVSSSGEEKCLMSKQKLKALAATLPQDIATPLLPHQDTSISSDNQRVTESDCSHLCNMRFSVESVPGRLALPVLCPLSTSLTEPFATIRPDLSRRT